MKDEPKVLLGGIVRVINTTAQFAFPVFYQSIFHHLAYPLRNGLRYGQRFSLVTSSLT